MRCDTRWEKPVWNTKKNYVRETISGKALAAENLFGYQNEQVIQLWPANVLREDTMMIISQLWWIQAGSS